MDDFSTITWLFLIKYKYDVFVSIQGFVQYVHTQFAKIVKTIRFDSGTGFVNFKRASMFQKLGIMHHRSCLYTPQKNGVAERKHRNLREVTRPFRFQAKIPIKYRGRCVLIAAYIINRLPRSVLHFQTPYERLYGSKPLLSHFKTISCLCFAKSLAEHDKLMPRARSAIHMGYSTTQK